MKKVKILLLGIGGYGINYLKEMTEKTVTSAEIEGVCEVMPNLYEQFPVLKEKKIPVYKTPEDFFKEHKADLAVISTPIHLHYSHVRTCLMAGADVLCEKPVTTSVKEADELIEMEKETGHFVAIGYQLNYSRDIWKLKQDILDGRFGKPVMMKALHAMSRGRNYYSRNGWAGRIKVNGCEVNDSPFNNACAHQFQIMTFLLGNTMDDAMDVKEINAELYRANPEVENFDTAAVHARMENGTDLYYYTTHDLAEKKLGPVCEYRFEKGTVYFGKDFGNGPVNEYVAVLEDGTTWSYGDIPKGERLQKFYDAIDCVREGGHPVCTIRCAIPHLEAVNALAQLPIWDVREECIDIIEENGDRFCRIRDAGTYFQTCYLNQKMPSEVGAGWKI